MPLPRPSDRVADRLAILGSAVLFSTGGVGIKWLTFDAWQVAALRALLAGIAVYFLVPGRISFRHRAVLVTGAAQGGAMLLFVLANKTTTAANAIFLQSAAPLFIPLLAARFLGEHATRRDLVAMVGIAVGLSFFFVGAPQPSVTAPHPRLGDFLAIASGLCWAGTVVGLRYLAREGALVDGVAKGALVWGNFLVAAVAMPMALPLPAVAASEWGVLLFLGVAQVALAYRLLARALARVPALEASLLALFEPVLNPVWAFLLLGELPTSWALLGAAVLGGVTVARAVSSSRPSA
ncbi:MAG: DMT family transporter [Candidatus Binatia bacterium]